jgi:chromosome segregation protein
MDAIIVTLYAWLLDWQQTAVANTRYTVVVIVLSLFVCFCVMWLWQRRRFVTWQQQIAALQEDKTQVEQNALKQTTELQQQYDLAEKKIATLDEQCQAEQQKLKQIEQHSLQLQQTIQDKDSANIRLQQQLDQSNEQLGAIQAEIELLQRQLEEKNVPAEIQAQLDDREKQHQEDQQKLAQMEQDKAGITHELEQINNQLQAVDDELAQKNAVISRMEQTYTKPQSNGSDAAEQQRELALLKKQLQDAEHEAGKFAELEQYIQRQNEQLLQLNRQLSEALSVEATEDLRDRDGQGFFSKLLTLVRKIDNSVLEETPQQNSSVPEKVADSLWQEHTHLIESLLAQLQPLGLNDSNDLSVPAPSSSESLVHDEDDTVHDLQRKVKGIYQKWLSK